MNQLVAIIPGVAHPTLVATTDDRDQRGSSGVPGTVYIGVPGTGSSGEFRGQYTQFTPALDQSTVDM